MSTRTGLRGRNRSRTQELVDAVASSADVSKAAVTGIIGAVLDVVSKTVAAGESVQLIGFGTFATGDRAARSGRNSKTGETIEISAAKTLKFSGAKAFEDALNQ
jgi:DNA-binding protein HU-beta